MIWFELHPNQLQWYEEHLFIDIIYNRNKGTFLQWIFNECSTTALIWVDIADIALDTID